MQQCKIFSYLRSESPYKYNQVSSLIHQTYRFPAVLQVYNLTGLQRIVKVTKPSTAKYAKASLEASPTA